MKKLTWWFRMVGGFYLLLAAMNLYFVLVDPSFAGTMITFPFAATPAAVQAFVDGWSPFAFEVFGLATFMLWASFNPRRYLGAVWLLVWLEFTHGVLDDIYLIWRGVRHDWLPGFHRRSPGDHRDRHSVCAPGRGGSERGQGRLNHSQKYRCRKRMTNGHIIWTPGWAARPAGMALLAVVDPVHDRRVLGGLFPHDAAAANDPLEQLTAYRRRPDRLDGAGDYLPGRLFRHCRHLRDDGRRLAWLRPALAGARGRRCCAPPGFCSGCRSACIAWSWAHRPPS
jgi:hypothetical protein